MAWRLELKLGVRLLRREALLRWGSTFGELLGVAAPAVDSRASSFRVSWPDDMILWGVAGNVEAHPTPARIRGRVTSAQLHESLREVVLDLRTGGASDAIRVSAHEDLAVKLAANLGPPTARVHSPLVSEPAYDRSWVVAGIEVQHEFIDQEWGCSVLILRRPD